MSISINPGKDKSQDQARFQGRELYQNMNIRRYGSLKRGASLQTSSKFK